MVKGLASHASNDSVGVGGQAAPALDNQPGLQTGTNLAAKVHTGPAIGDGSTAPVGTAPTGVPHGNPSAAAAGGSVGFGNPKPHAAHVGHGHHGVTPTPQVAPAAKVVPEVNPILGRDGKPLPLGVDGEMTALSPKEWDKVVAASERLRYSLPFRVFKDVAHGVSSGVVNLASIPAWGAGLVGKGLAAVGAKKAGESVSGFAAAIRPKSAQATLDAQAPKTTEGKALSFAGQTATMSVAAGAAGLQGVAGTAAKTSVKGLKLAANTLRVAE